jgi:hypothetical protein
LKDTPFAPPAAAYRIRKKVNGMKNVGTVDRMIRILISIGLFSVLVVLHGSLKWLGLIGLIPLVTAIAGFCPLYALLHISTNHSTGKQ